MEAYNYTFRRYLKKYNRSLTTKDLDRHEDLYAKRVQYRLDYNMYPSRYCGSEDERTNYQTELSNEINKVIKKADDIKESKMLYYDKIYKLWVTQREFSMEQGYLMQIPPTRKGIVRYLRKSFKYLWVRIETEPYLWWKIIKQNYEDTVKTLKYWWKCVKVYVIGSTP